MKKKREKDLQSGKEWVYYLTFAAPHFIRPGGEERKQGHAGTSVVPDNKQYENKVISQWSESD